MLVQLMVAKNGRSRSRHVHRLFGRVGRVRAAGRREDHLLRINESYAAIARKHWAAAGVPRRRSTCAWGRRSTRSSTLPTGGFDYAFIDADKSNYDAYY